jgi:hypothetical protein
MAETDSKPWWKEPMVWLIAGLPALAVVGGITTAIIASDNPDSLVNHDYQKVGMAVTDTGRAALERAAALGLSAALGRDEAGMTLRLTGPANAAPDRLQLEFRHSVATQQDRTVLFIRSADMEYKAPWQDLGAGKRLLTLEPKDRSWRLVGEWREPFSEETRLGASVPGSSTHP